MEPRPQITGFEVEQFRAFPGVERLELGRITLLLGRNNAGKSALCFAPLYFAQACRPDAPVPLPQEVDGIDFGRVGSAVHNEQLSGLRFELTLQDADTSHFGLTVTESLESERRQPIVTAVRLGPCSEAVSPRLPWEELRGRIAAHPALGRLPDEVLGLKGIRPGFERVLRPVRFEPAVVGPLGSEAAQILFERGRSGLEAVNEWYRTLGVTIGIRPEGEHFALIARGSGGAAVNLADSGAGLAQALPLAVQVLLARRMPRLWCVEQPELHLHPRAHVAVAELLLEGLNRHPSTRLLVETHSDVLVLRLRREVALGHLAPEDLRIFFVDESDPGPGSRVKPIPLGEDAAPMWWPRDVFAEPQREYAAIRRALRERVR